MNHHDGDWVNDPEWSYPDEEQQEKEEDPPGVGGLQKVLSFCTSPFLPNAKVY